MSIPGGWVTSTVVCPPGAGPGSKLVLDVRDRPERPGEGPRGAGGSAGGEGGEENSADGAAVSGVLRALGGVAQAVGSLVVEGTVGLVHAVGERIGGGKVQNKIGRAILQRLRRAIRTNLERRR